MPNDLNRVIMIGRLVRDPELRSTQTGTSVASFSIASNRVYMAGTEKKEQTSFFNCVAWGKLGELISQYCKRGKQICVEGRLQQRSWADKDGVKHSTVEIITENIQFLSPRDSSSSGDTPMENSPYQEMSHSQEMDVNPFSEDEIPF